MSINIYYDSHCVRCQRFIRWLRVLMRWEKLNYVALDEALPEIQALSQKHFSWIVEIDHKKYIRGEAFLRLLSVSNPYWPLGKLFCAWPIRWMSFPVANGVYKLLQSKNYCRVE